MPQRQADLLRHSQDNAQNDGDFVVRKSIPPIWQLIILFTVCFCVLFSVALNTDTLGGPLALGFAIFAVIGPLTWFTIYFNQRNRDMVMAAEFQNAIFSAAARLKTRFCMIVQKDGTIFYYDRGFQSVFPETTYRGTLMVDKIFNNQFIAPAEAEKLYRALDNNSSDAVFLTLKEPNGQEQKLVLTIDPLPRPQGFFILRGRDYVTKQYERNANATAELQLSHDKRIDLTLTHMIHALPMGLYSTDADGNFLFVNYQVENWLGYEQNEIVSRRLNIHDLLPTQNTPDAENILLKPFTATVLFRNRQGENVTLHIQQQISKDERGAVIGSVASVRKEDIAFQNQPSTTPTPQMPGKIF